MIVGILQMLIVRIMIHQSAEGFFAEREVIQLILEDDARMIESVFQELVAFCQLLWRERNLGEVVLPLVRIVHGTVGNLLERIFLGSHIGERISHLVGHFLGSLCRCNHRLVDTLPVIHIFSFAPEFLELRLTLAHCHRRIEVPLTLVHAVHAVHGIVGVGIILLFIVIGKVAAISALLVSGCIFFCLFVLLFLFLLFQSSNHTVDGCVAVFLVHLCQCLQRILQGDGIGVRHQFIEHLRTVGELFVVITLLVEQSDGFAVTALGIGEFLSNPVDVAQVQKQYTFLYTASRGLGNAFLVGTDGLQGVFLSQVDVADGVIYLVQIFLVVI